MARVVRRSGYQRRNRVSVASVEIGSQVDGIPVSISAQLSDCPSKSPARATMGGTVMLQTREPS